MSTLYTKQGRRYTYWGDTEEWHHCDTMRAGQFRLTHCPSDGSRRYSYDVTPDTAAFLAACELAAVAMEKAINAKRIAQPSPSPVPYTKRQAELVAKFRADMAEAGAFVPEYWTHSTSREIVQAGIDAVKTAASAAREAAK